MIGKLYCDDAQRPWMPAIPSSIVLWIIAAALNRFDPIWINYIRYFAGFEMDNFGPLKSDILADPVRAFQQRMDAVRG